jgi:hypothetical protein
MINFKIRHNLDNLKNVINNLPNDIASATSAAFMESSNNLKDLLIQEYGNCMNDVILSINYDGNSMSINIQNVNPYYLYNATGKEISDVTQYIMDYLNNNISKELGRIPLLS